MKSSGFDGLIGIKEVTKWKEIKVLRPLLKIKKKEILNFLASKKIPYVTDKSNFDYKFERVKSRKFLKLLKENEFCNIEKKLYKYTSDLLGKDLAFQCDPSFLLLKLLPFFSNFTSL